jgi:hypothetical protein
VSPPPGAADDGLIVDGGLGSRASLKGSRTRRSAAGPDPRVFASWPGAWIERLAHWLRSPAERRQIAALQRGADGPSVVEITQLIDALLRAGWISLVEQHQRGGHWQPRELRWIDADALRRTLGLAVAADLQARQQSIATRRFDGAAALLHAALLELPPTRWTRRIDLVEAIARWESEGRGGTRRDFELLARRATKSISNGEWEWLAQNLDLEALRIGGHTPGLWLRASCVLRTPHGALDLAAAGELLALTPATVQALLAIERPPQQWVVVENRTSFERRARTATADEAVLWVPGRPPSWWLAAARALLRLAPAPLQVACDPDPAGIAIADEVARLWQARGLPWQPLHMDPTALAALADTRPLNDFDRQLLDALAERPLHPQLAALREALLASGRKGEQEGLL